jgi:hypothetical protein
MYASRHFPVFLRTSLQLVCFQNEEVWNAGRKLELKKERKGKKERRNKRMN